MVNGQDTVFSQVELSKTVTKIWDYFIMGLAVVFCVIIFELFA